MKVDFTNTVKDKLRDCSKGITPDTDPEDGRFVFNDSISEYDPYKEDVSDTGIDIDPMDLSPVSEEEN